MSEEGETVGPWTEADVVRAIDRGLFTVAAVVRDNAGGQWTPIGSSPFAHRFAVARPVHQSDQGWWVRWAIVFGVLAVAFVSLIRFFIGVAAGP